jgi:hypothetical protein
MALSYTIDPSERLITITGEYAEADEWRELLQRILADERRQPGFAFLRDLREATTPISTTGVVALMDVVRRFWPLLQPSRAAILTPRGFDPAAMVAHALADSHHLPIRVFNSLDTAMDWLRGAGSGEPDEPATHRTRDVP